MNVGVNDRYLGNAAGKAELGDGLTAVQWWRARIVEFQIFLFFIFIFIFIANMVVLFF